MLVHNFSHSKCGHCCNAPNESLTHGRWFENSKITTLEQFANQCKA